MSTISIKLRRITVEESKLVRDLLAELELSKDHVVLVEGKRLGIDDIIEDNTLVVVLPLIAGG